MCPSGTISREPALDLIVIPARYGSTRLPGKPLIEIAGRSLLDRVHHVARRAIALVDDVQIVVATDDDRIERHARTLGCHVARTDPAISSGSGRACAAASAHQARPQIVVNLQGDAPFIEPDTIAAIIVAARASQAAAVTAVVQLSWDALDRLREHKSSSPFSGTTCVRRADGMALWFSKTILPAIRDEARLRDRTSISPVFRHLGLYAFRLEALERFERTEPTPYERLEGLEQLRLLEIGLDILTVDVAPPRIAMSGIDTLADVALAEALIAEFGDPHIA